MERRDEQSIEAVKLYYQQGLSQAEVATRMGLSRPTVAKLLAHGRERGFVTIEIHDPREDASGDCAAAGATLWTGLRSRCPWRGRDRG